MEVQADMIDVVVCPTPGELKLEQRPSPRTGQDEVMVRIRRVGLCGTDMHIYRGTQPYLSYPRVMGHELSGEVVEAPEATGLRPGDPVYIIPYLACQSCAACRKGKPNCCSRIQVLGVHRDGGLAQLLSVPAIAVHKAEGITLDQAAMVEFLAIGAHAVRRADVSTGQKVLVVGTGPIGIAAALFSKLRGAEVTGLDGREDRLAFCRDVIGVDHSVMLSPDAHAALSELTGGDFFDVVFDATGSPKAMEAGFAYVGHGGTYVLVSVVSSDITFSDPEFHKRETTLMGSRNATAEDFALVVEAMRRGDVPTDALHTHSATLAELPKRLPEWMQPEAGVIKAIVAC